MYKFRIRLQIASNIIMSNMSWAQKGIPHDVIIFNADRI